MKYDWDDGEKCCYDNEHQKWEYNKRDVDHRQKCDQKDYDWDDNQKCCYDKHHKEWDYDDDDDDHHKQKCGEIGYDWDNGQKCRSWGQLPNNALAIANFARYLGCYDNDHKRWDYDDKVSNFVLGA
jgi:hypothetical protein